MINIALPGPDKIKFQSWILNRKQKPTVGMAEYKYADSDVTRLNSDKVIW
jgi:hypothetical protein